jgi:hypothetical protein
MATITDWVTVSEARIPASCLNKAFVLKNTIDFSAVNAESGDVVQVLAIPAGTMVLDVLTKVVTKEGATCTADVGDTTDADGFNAGADFNATAGSIEQSAASPTDAYFVTTTRGKVYTTAKTLDFTMNNAADTAVIQVFAICFDILNR